MGESRGESGAVWKLLSLESDCSRPGTRKSSRPKPPSGVACSQSAERGHSEWVR